MWKITKDTELNRWPKRCLDEYYLQHTPYRPTKRETLEKSQTWFFGDAEKVSAVRECFYPDSDVFIISHENDDFYVAMIWIGDPNWPIAYGIVEQVK